MSWSAANAQTGRQCVIIFPNDHSNSEQAKSLNSSRCGLWLMHWSNFRIGLSSLMFMKSIVEQGWILMSITDFFLIGLVVVRAVLRSVVRTRVCCISVRSIGLCLLFLMVDWHQVLHVHRILSFLVRSNANGSKAGNDKALLPGFDSFAMLDYNCLPEQNRGDQGQSHPDPWDNVGPFVFELGVILELLQWTMS